MLFSTLFCGCFSFPLPHLPLPFFLVHICPVPKIELHFLHSLPRDKMVHFITLCKFCHNSHSLSFFFGSKPFKLCFFQFFSINVLLQLESLRSVSHEHYSMLSRYQKFSHLSQNLAIPASLAKSTLLISFMLVHPASFFSKFSAHFLPWLITSGTLAYAVSCEGPQKEIILNAGFRAERPWSKIG